MKVRNSLYVFGFLTILSLLLFWPILLGKVNLNGNLLVSFFAPYGENLPYKYTGWDALRIYFPFYKITLEAFKNFSIPLWNPYAFAGHPHMADFQTAVFYPLNIAGFFLSQIEFWHFLRITPSILASFFTFLYLRTLRLSFCRQLSVMAAFFGAATFGFSPFILTWGEEVVMSAHSIIWLPLALLAVEKYLAARSGKGRYLALLALCIGFSLLGGYMQTSIYLVIFVICYLIFRLWQMPIQTRFVKLFQTGFGIALGIGIAGIQLVPSAELFFNSARSTISLRETLFEFLLPLKNLLTYLAPDFFGHPATHNYFRGGSAQYYESIVFVGVAILLFFVWEVARGREKLVRFLAIFGVIALSTSLDLPSSRLFLSLPIPFLSTSIANRILFVPAFCIAIIGAIGFERWLVSKDESVVKIVRSFGAIYGILFLYLLGVKFFNWPYWELMQKSQENALISLRNLLIPGLVMVVTGGLILCCQIARWRKNWSGLVIVTVAFLQIFLFSQKYFSFTSQQYVFPGNSILNWLVANQDYFRSWGVADAFLANNFASQYGIFWPEGYDSLNNRVYGEFTYAMQGHDVSDYVLRSDAGLGSLGEASVVLSNSNRRRLMDLVGVRYVIAKNADFEAVETAGLRKVLESRTGDGGYGIFENPTVMPRVFLASNYEQVEKGSKKKIIKRLLAGDFDLGNVVILEKSSTISPQFGDGNAQIVNYKPQEVIVKTQSSQPKLLFLSDNFYPGWKATVDGDKTEILRADYTFRVVALTPGEHMVRFYYDSETFKIGLLISILSLGILAFLFGRPNLKLT